MPQSNIEPYLNFDGRCEEALEFYKKALGAEVTALLRMKDNPQPSEECRPAPENANKVMHSVVKIGSSTFMASDCESKGQATFKGISLSLNVPDEAAADKAFAALSDGGKVGMPLTKTFWSPRFGMVTDRFGVEWLVNTCAPQK